MLSVMPLRRRGWKVYKMTYILQVELVVTIYI